MEHRHSDRLSADLNVVIYKQNLLVTMGIVKNIGKEGVFIESGFAEITTNQPLEIEFFASDSALKSRRFKAVVVHRSERGFGAEIEDIAEKIRLALLAEPVKPARNSKRPADAAGNSGLPAYASTAAKVVATVASA